VSGHISLTELEAGEIGGLLHEVAM